MNPRALFKALIALKLVEKGEVSLDEFVAIVKDSAEKLRRRGYDVEGHVAYAAELVIINDGKVRLSEYGLNYLKALDLPAESH